MLQLLTCSRGHSWEAAADDGAAVGRAVCPVCGDAVELMPLFDLAPSLDAVTASPEPILPQAPPIRDAAGKPVVAGFEVLEELGRSSLGVRLYKAKQVLINRTVLLKVVVARDDAGQVGWGALRGEAAALGRLSHPNITPILEAGERERQLFYNAVEWVEGPTLAQHAAGKPMPPRQAVQLVEVLARAAHAAHEQGVVHRGLRPACIRLQPLPEGDKRRSAGAVEPPYYLAGGKSRCLPKIGDFGLARRPVEGDAADVELYEDAPTGLSPEQAWGRAREIGPSSDIYALGAILYELLSGRPPFRGRSAGEMLDFIRGGDPPYLYGRAPGITNDMAVVCRKAMQRNPRNRYPTALAFAEDLRALLAGRPIKAWKKGAFGRLVLWTRRRPLVALLLLLCLLAPIGVLIAYSVGAGDASAAKEQVSSANIRADASDAQKAGVQKDLADARKQGQRTAYFHHILLVDQALRDGRTERARELLTECAADQRNWEWQYLNYRINSFNPSEYLSLVAPEQQPIADFAFSPDGRWLAAALSGDNAEPKREVRLWNLASPETVHDLTGFDGPIRRIAFSPDGKRLATAWANDSNLDADRLGELREWDPMLARPLSPRPLAMGGRLPRDAAYSPDGNRLVAVDDHGGLHAFAAGAQTETRLGVTTAPDFQSRAYRLAVLNKDGTRLAVVTAGGWTVQICDTQRNGLAVRAAQNVNGITALAFSSEANLLASAAGDGTVVVWDVQGSRQAAAMRAHLGAVTSVSFTRDGRRLATTGDDGRIRIWEPATGQEVFEFTPFDNGQGVTAVQFSPAKDDWRLAAAHGNEVRVFGPAHP